MRRALVLSVVGVASFGCVACIGCSSGGAGPAANDAASDATAARPGDAAGASSDGANPPGTPPCAGHVGEAPASNACDADAGPCLSGTAGLDKFRVMRPAHMCASLYRLFPEGTSQYADTQLVARDGTWAFSNVDSSARYFVRVVADFDLGARASSIAAIVGPVSAGSPAVDGGTRILVKPIQLGVLQASTAAGGPHVLWVSARVFDPSSGVELTDSSTVGVTIGDASAPMHWQTDLGGGQSYFVQFAAPVAAQPEYTITTTDPAFVGVEVGDSEEPSDSGVFAWKLSAGPTPAGGTITAPADLATVPTDAGLAVAWVPEPADYELTALFRMGDAGWVAAYGSPGPNDPDAGAESLPKLGAGNGQYLDPGEYLLNLAFANAHCPASADGCVLAESIAQGLFTAQ